MEQDLAILETQEILMSRFYFQSSTGSKTLGEQVNLSYTQILSNIKELSYT